MLRLPDTVNVKYTPHRPVTIEYVHEDRAYALVEFEKLLADVPEPGESPEEKARLSQSLNTQDTIPEGQRDHTLFRIGCRLRAKGCEEPDILSQLTRENNQRCSPPLSQAEVEKCARSAAKYEKGAETTFPYTEAGDAEFFAFKHRKDVRFDHARKRWLHFDGNRWRPDEQGFILTLALAAMRDRQRIALQSKGDDEARRRNIKWTITGESKNRLRNLLTIAQSLDPIADDGTDWDTKQMIIGTPKGVVPLDTGVLRPGRPEDRITNCTRVEYDPDATSELWRTTLAAIFENNDRMMAYWQRFIGYALSGTAQEEVFPLLWGGGRNGKGTIIESLRSALGDYADDLPFASLEKNARGAISNDMAKLPGKRFVTASETEGGYVSTSHG